MTTASRSQHRSCIKTSEYPLPCSSVKHKHSYSLRASNRHHVPLLRMISSSSLPLKASTRAAEKPPFTPPPFAGHAQQLQPRACPLSWLPRCCARSMQKHRKCSSGSQTTPQSKRRKGALLTPGPPQTAATNLLQSLDVLGLPHQHLPNKRHLRLESLKIKSSEGFFHCQFREFSQNTEHTDSCNADFAAFYFFDSF